MTFQRRKKLIWESRCRQISVHLQVFGEFFALYLNPSTTTVYAQSAFYSSLPFTLSLKSAFYMHSAFNPWSAVCSPWSTISHLTLTAFDTHTHNPQVTFH